MPITLRKTYKIELNNVVIINGKLEKEEKQVDPNYTKHITIKSNSKTVKVLR